MGRLKKLFGFFTGEKSAPEQAEHQSSEEELYRLTTETISRVVNETSALAIAEKIVRAGMMEDRQNEAIANLQARLARLEEQKVKFIRMAALIALIVMFIVGICLAQTLRG